ncbi:MAG: single-stranded DNA-binding protein [Polaribacter sp.]
MASTVNKVILIGNMGDDVKMHYFDDKNSIGRFPLATSESYTNKETGEKIINTDWHNIVVRNKLAEICEKHLIKGDKIYVEGKLKNRQWEQDGIKRYSTEVVATEMTFLSAKKNVDTTLNASKSQNSSSETATKPNATKEKDDLPF